MTMTPFRLVRRDRLDTRAGMTLLEVLVALGILVAGLASVAALMPAAGARLSDATAIDRAGTLSANAHADLRNRNLLTGTALFPDKTIKIAMLGKLASLDSASDPFTTGTFPKYPTILPASASVLQDDLQFGAPNTIVTNAEGVCYGATVIPTGTANVEVGSRAMVSVVVFKKQPVASPRISLIKVSGGVFTLSGSGAIPEATRKKFFPPCSWVFAVDAGNLEKSQWLHIGSSWTTQSYDAQGRLIPAISSVSFSNAEASMVAAVAVSGTLPVYGFTRVLRVDEQPAILK